MMIEAGRPPAGEPDPPRWDQRERRHPGQGKIYVRETTGPHTRRRWAVIWLTQLVFYGLPWLEWNGRAAVLFDLPARRFYLFDLVLWPQDLIYLAAFLVACALLLFLASAIGGRLWCSHGCPHSVYTELFMWIEHRIEGSRSSRMRRDSEPLTAPWSARKAAKHVAWVLLALWTGVTLVAYFTPMPVLLAKLARFSPGPWETFWILAYAGLAYVNAGWMREQFCQTICAYARFQVAMFDRDTSVITYDARRGEPRGPRGRRGVDPSQLGECIDCTWCVQVCPAGVDIRDGFQYACIDCGACIDACDAVLKKTGAAPGLIRYASQADEAAEEATLLTSMVERRGRRT